MCVENYAENKCLTDYNGERRINEDNGCVFE